jgi:hypothetical protein
MLMSEVALRLLLHALQVHVELGSGDRLAIDGCDGVGGRGACGVAASSEEQQQGQCGEGNSMTIHGILGGWS